ncbi:MAG: efflux RND transporter periplasmic adaptor subunit [Mesorhizobium sp.]|nr:efflux RND transporter periplasmic adaptor subunit [Mesorhizobium sp.]MBL8575928.1 efflux RND transporter periplasmic adaptor subunit [Mesorhizobium sp.]
MDQIVDRNNRLQDGNAAGLKEPGTQSASESLGLTGTKGRKRGRRWLYVVGALALFAAAASYWHFSSGSSNQPTYVTATVEPGDITVQVSATGTLQPLIQVDISSELSGVVRSVSVDENQRVKQGEVLAELDTTRLEAQIDGARASVKSAEAKILEAKTTLTESQQAFARAEQLLKRDMASQQVLDTATATRDRADANVAMAEANLAIAEATLKQQEADLVKSKIYAPIDGIVLTRSVNPGQTVASSMQAPVLFVLAANLENMELEAAIDEADIGSVKAGQSARFTVDAFPERSFDADIRDISFASVTTEGVVTYNARLDVDNSELLLRPGMTATVSVVTREAKGVLTAPAAAFRYSPPATTESRGFSLRDMFMPRMGPPRGGRQQQRNADPSTRTLYVLKDGAPQAVQVKTGSSDGEVVEIVSGLSEGDQVITGSRSASAQGR